MRGKGWLFTLEVWGQQGIFQLRVKGVSQEIKSRGKSAVYIIRFSSDVLMRTPKYRSERRF